MYYKKIRIGNQEIENNIFLAPMAGVTDKSYRKVCKEMGAGLVYTEMISSRAVFHDDTKTKLLMNTEGEKGQLLIKYLEVMRSQWHIQLDIWKIKQILLI